MKALKLILVFMLLLTLFFPVPEDTHATGVSVKRLTAWNMEKKSATATVGLRNLVVEGSDGQLAALRIDPQSLQVQKLTYIYSHGLVKGPSSAPGIVRVTSEPRLPSYGDWVYMNASSAGKHYLLSIHVSGGGARYFQIPDTKIDGISVRWSLLWFQLSLTGDRFLGVVRGDVITPGKSGKCVGLVSMSTEGKGFRILSRPKWDGEKFFYGKNDVGKLVAPVGMSSRTGQIFFKAELGTSGKHGIYKIGYDGTGLKLIKRIEGTYKQTTTTNISYSLDYVTDDGKYLILNDHGTEYEEAITMDASTGETVAYLAHNSNGISADGLYSFFKDSDGLGFEFTIGGNPFILIKPDDANFPATTDLNNNRNINPPRGAVTVLPFGYLALSKTDITSTGQVYFISITNPPSLKRSKLEINPRVCDLGIVDEDATLKIDIQNSAGTRLSGRAEIISRQGSNPFSISGKSSSDFTNITDIHVNATVDNLLEGFTYERTMELKSTAGNMDVPIILTRNNPHQLLARLGLDRTVAWIGADKVGLNIAPFSDDGTTMVPLRFIIDLLPCDFTWDAKNMKAIIDYQDYHFEIGIGEDYCIIGDRIREVTTPAVIKGGQTFIPLRLAAEAFGANIHWYEESRSILLIFTLPEWGRETLTFEGIPNRANIKVNYIDKGTAPLTLKHLKPGRYMVEVSREGYKPYTTIFTLPTEDGSPPRVLYFLERIVPTTTILKVASNPEGAHVYIDDTPVAITPCELETKPGLHILKVALMGYPAHTKQIICLAGVEMELFADLEAEKEKLSNLVSPNIFEGTIDHNYSDELLFDLSLENKLGVSQAFVIECPDDFPIGFDSVTIKTMTGEKTTYTTPKIAPGEKLNYKVSVKTDSWISPGDSLSSQIIIQAKDFNSWQAIIPLKVEITGKEAGFTKLEISAPVDIDIGDEIEVFLTVKDIIDLNAMKARLIFQPSKLELLSITPGDLYSDKKNIIFAWHRTSNSEIDIAGPVILGNIPGIEGEGALLKIRFKAILDGDAILDFSFIKLIDSEGEEIEHNTINSRVISIWKISNDSP